MGVQLCDPFTQTYVVVGLLINVSFGEVIQEWSQNLKATNFVPSHVIQDYLQCHYMK